MSTFYWHFFTGLQTEILKKKSRKSYRGFYPVPSLFAIRKLLALSTTMLVQPLNSPFSVHTKLMWSAGENVFSMSFFFWWPANENLSFFYVFFHSIWKLSKIVFFNVPSRQADKLTLHARSRPLHALFLISTSSLCLHNNCELAQRQLKKL